MCKNSMKTQTHDTVRQILEFWHFPPIFGIQKEQVDQIWAVYLFILIIHHFIIIHYFQERDNSSRRRHSYPHTIQKLSTNKIAVRQFGRQLQNKFCGKNSYTVNDKDFRNLWG